MWGPTLNTGDPVMNKKRHGFCLCVSYGLQSLIWILWEHSKSDNFNIGYNEIQNIHREPYHN